MNPEPQNPLVSTFLSCWEAYAKVYLPADADPVQVACMQHCFFVAGGILVKATQEMIKEKASRKEIEARLNWMAADITAQLAILGAKESTIQ